MIFYVWFPVLPPDVSSSTWTLMFVTEIFAIFHGFNSAEYPIHCNPMLSCQTKAIHPHLLLILKCALLLNLIFLYRFKWLAELELHL